ncbi:MAG: trypsin-like peptidase domain-containing protein [Candidatus Marinimicrobia bacterium]|jgi:serine protease Do|nr:trypsin-like peptidase domain-containing protein [Candidatus Neomarinimicrobiota bacterium]MBT4361888.1 trypsin-like peptidase domain-containing protein [Candidatus Neomarinimicrobiota bacterium]MBT4946809.1 trypsin-like peptidase domain-containing protein [Candidatus Neomarinimicrobiota bacterium]MBT5270590.1 trypsin-like peptidase domain-containing protein [Candidatus Neomarinimicrobiota bacterium]MBT6002388.1 trypsin-like peptidase domain-containing protein [Candidatus Neomarinimicrobiota
MKISISINILVLAIIMMVGCVPPQENHSTLPGRPLNAYKYVVVLAPSYEGSSVDQYGVASKLSQMFQQEGMVVLSQDAGLALDEKEKPKLVICGITHNHTPDSFGGSYATVKITLMNTYGETVYAGTGRYQGLSIIDDLAGASREAFKGFSAKYVGYNPALALSPADVFGDVEVINKSEIELKSYLDSNQSTLDPIEGIWEGLEDNKYRIGIFKNAGEGNRDYAAYILESTNSYWQPYQVKMEIRHTAYPKIYSINYYMANHSKQSTTATIDDIGFLKFSLKDSKGERFDSNFIKHYPKMTTDGRMNISGTETPHSKSSGSGFLIANVGLVVTNHHVIANASSIEVTFPSFEQSFQATIALKDVSNDLVILRITDPDYLKFSTSLPKIPFGINSKSPIRLGESVFTLGYPLSNILGDQPRLSTGSINSLYGIQDDPRLYQISNPLQPGNSGGGLFSENGDLIGIVVSSLNAKYFYEELSVIPQNVNFAVKKNYLTNLISMMPEGDDILNSNSSIGADILPDKIEKLTPFIVAVKSY